MQFKLADMATDLFTARSAIRQAAATLDAKAPLARAQCAMAKRVATDLGFQVRLARLGGWVGGRAGRSVRRADVATGPARRLTYRPSLPAQVCNDALQLHGGYGYLQSYPIERYLRDVRVHQILEGTNEIMRLIVSRSLTEGK